MNLTIRKYKSIPTRYWLDKKKIDGIESVIIEELPYGKTQLSLTMIVDSVDSQQALSVPDGIGGFVDDESSPFEVQESNQSEANTCNISVNGLKSYNEFIEFLKAKRPPIIIG